MPTTAPAERPLRRSPAALLPFLLLAFGAAASGALYPPGEWYAGIEKPAWNPPDWIFGPVWTVLYALMAVAAWLVWRRAGLRGAAGALGLWLAQLALNALWSLLFFGLHRPDLALAEILALLLAIAATALAFRRHSRVAAALLVPYLAWVCFATVLNATLWRLNA